MAKTLFDKIWEAHRIADLGDGAALIAIDRVLLHERTGGVALQSLESAGYSVLAPERAFATMDHVVDTRPGRTDETVMPTGRDFIVATREAARKAGIMVFDIGDPRQGIVHIISPEQGIIQPGSTLVCPDSHTCSQGALGGLAWGIGSSEAEHALATGTLRIQKPGTMRITVSGRLSTGVTAKDLALYVLEQIGAAGSRGLVLEYAGEAIGALDIDERLTLCNMATELGAFTAIIAPDDKTFAYLEGRPFSPQGALWTAARAAGRDLVSDPGARFDREWTMDAADVAPMITWGTSPQHAVRLGAAVPKTGESDRDTPGRSSARSTIWGSNPSRRSSGSGSTRRSSARAPTAASRTCAAWRRSCAGSASPRMSARSAFRARARSASRRRRKGCTGSSSTPGSNGARLVVRCASTQAARASARRSA